MEDVKLPDLSELRQLGKRKKQLPPQKSPDDTSNWDDRAFSAPNIKADREVTFSHAPIEYAPVNPYLEQERTKSVRNSKKKNK